MKNPAPTEPTSSEVKSQPAENMRPSSAEAFLSLLGFFPRSTQQFMHALRPDRKPCLAGDQSQTGRAVSRSVSLREDPDVANRVAVRVARSEDPTPERFPVAVARPGLQAAPILAG